MISESEPNFEWILSRHKPFNLLLYDSKLQITSTEAVPLKNSSNKERTYSRAQNDCIKFNRKRFLISVVFKLMLTRLRSQPIRAKHQFEPNFAEMIFLILLE